MMKKTRKTVKAMLSIFLTIVFIVQLLPAQVLSVDKTDETNTPSHDFAQTATDPVEIVELRDAYTKHYRSPEGQYYAEVHAQPVHYKQGGAWKDYDLSLQAKETEDGYFVRGTDTPVTFPQNFADGGKITVSHGTYSVGFGVSAANAGFNAKSSARTMSKTEDTSGVSDELRYAKVLPNVDFTYTALPNGVKENVIVHKKQKSYRYTFDMDFSGLLPVKQEDGSIYLMVSANAKKPTFILDMPYMVDDAGQYSEAVTMTVQGNRLTLEADAAWMNASDRTFPVTIDPYCYVPIGSSSYIRSTYVTNLHPNQNYYGKISTGRNGLYSDRTYFQFAFPTLSEEYTFYRASLILHQNLGMHSGAQNYIDMYDLSGYDEWERSDITWNDQPVGSTFGAYAGTPRVAYNVLSDESSTVYTFNISSIAEAYYDDEEDNGYLLAMRREDAGEFSWMGDVGGPNGTPPEMRVYYTRPCIGCGDKCVYESVNGSSCPCTCASWEVCNCPECGVYCGCGKLNCAYGPGCECECPNEAVCNCVACKGYSRPNKDEVTGDVTSYVITDGTKTMTETYTYNTDHAVTGMTDANGNTVQYTYAADSEQPSSITMGNSTVNYTYNTDDLLTGVSQSVTGLSSGTSIANGYTYDADKNVTSITHNDFAYNFVYDANGNNTQVKVGSEPLASYTYNANGDLHSVEYRTGEAVGYFYDTEGRLEEINYMTFDQPHSEFYFTYDADGNPVSIDNVAAETETVFDPDGSGAYSVYDQYTNEELHYVYYDNYNGHETVHTGGVWGSIGVEEQESEFDFVTGETTYTQNIETNDCDMVSQLVYDYFGRKTGSVTESENYIAENTLTVTESVGYNDTATTAGTLPTTYESRVEAGNVTATRAFRYTYDNKGNITAVYDTTTTPETLQAQYAYDEAGQLVREDNAELNQTVTYTYDKGGNITQKSIYPFTTGTPGTATDTIAYTYDSTWKDKLTSYDGATLTYDEIGDPYDYTHDRFFWWAARELRYADLANDLTVEYRYNENGLRCLKRMYNADWSDSDDYYYFWSDDGRLLAYTVDPMGSADLYSVLVLYNSDKEPIGFTVGEDTYYYLKNIQGDVLCVTDAEGTPIINYTYDAWGAMTVSPASQNVTSQTVVNVAFLNPVTYRGYFYDYELGLYYLQSRYYDPETGRFISADERMDTGVNVLGTNMYSYCYNNPLNYTDTIGNEPMALFANILKFCIYYGTMLAIQMAYWPLTWEFRIPVFRHYNIVDSTIMSTTITISKTAAKALEIAAKVGLTALAIGIGNHLGGIFTTVENALKRIFKPIIVEAVKDTIIGELLDQVNLFRKITPGMYSVYVAGFLDENENDPGDIDTVTWVSFVGPRSSSLKFSWVQVE